MQARQSRAFVRYLDRMAKSRIQDSEMHHPFVVQKECSDSNRLSRTELARLALVRPSTEGTAAEMDESPGLASSLCSACSDGHGLRGATNRNLGSVVVPALQFEAIVENGHRTPSLRRISS